MSGVKGRTWAWTATHRGPRMLAVRHSRLAREALRPPVASLPSRGLSRPLHPRRGTRPGSCDLPQPCADWMRGNGMSRCIDSQAFAPDTTTRSVPAPSTLPNRAPVGCAATACPVASTFGAFPRNPASGFRPRHHDRACRADGSRSAAPAPRSMTGAPDDEGLETRGGDVAGNHLFARPVAAGAAATAEAGPPYREHERPALRATSGCRSAHRMAHHALHARLSQLPCWRPPTKPG